MKNLNLKLSLLFFLQNVVWGSWYVTMGTYMLETLGFDGRQVGLIYGSTAIAATISPFLLGILADRFFAAERLLSILHYGGGLVMLFASTLQDFIWFYPIMILYALFYVPTFALSSSLSFYHIKDTTKDFPKIRVWGTIGWIIAGLTISYFGLETKVTPLLISATASFVLGTFCFLLPHTPPQSTGSKRSLSDMIGKEVLQLFQKRSFTVLIICIALIAIPSGYYYSFTNPFLTEIGVSNAAGKMSIGQGSEVIIMLMLPFLFARMGFKWIIGIGLFTWGIRYGLFAYGNAENSVWLLYLGIILHGIAYNFTFLTAQIYIDKIVPKHVKSSAQGFITLVTMGFGTLIGTFVAGETVRHYTLENGDHTWQAIWLIPTIIGIIVASAFVLFFRRDRDG